MSRFRVIVLPDFCGLEEASDASLTAGKSQKTGFSFRYYLTISTLLMVASTVAFAPTFV